jgi:hypothetical protein
MNKKDIAKSIAIDYSIALFEQFERLVIENMEKECSDDALEAVENHIDSDKYDTYAISCEVLKSDIQDIWEELKIEFEGKYVKKIDERVRQQIMDIDLIDYLI